MRILIATSNRIVVGGVETYLEALLPRLLVSGHELAIVHEEATIPGRETIDQPGGGVTTWSVAELGGEGAKRAFDQWKPDVVYSHGLRGADLESHLIENYPVVLYAHNYYGTCVSGRKCHSFPRATPCGRTFGPGCMVQYYPRRCGGLDPGTMWRMFQRQTMLHSRLPRFPAILVASRHMFEEFQFNGVNADKLHVVPLPATNIVPMSTAPRERIPSGRILFVGRLMDVKGVDYLIRAIAQVGRKLRLTVAGEGPERERLETLAKRLGVEAEFAGWVGTREKISLIQQADLVAVPSVWPEPFGLVGVEAGCLGVPAIAYQVGGIRDWLIPGESGELAPADPPSVEGLRDAILRALADQIHFSRLCRGAWENSKRFSMEAHLARLEPLLAAAVNRPEGVLAE